MDTLIAVLIVLTNTAAFDSSHATGVWLEEFAVPHQIFVEQHVNVTVASPLGGVVPVDPRSLNDEAKAKFAGEIELLKHTTPLADVDVSSYDAVFFPGGHGTMFDLPGNELVQKTIAQMYESGKVVAAVCHGPAALVDVKLADGKYLVDGKKIAAFTNSEEKAVELDQYMPFLLQSKLEEQGATVETGENFKPQVVVDGKLITGQNPASSEGVARGVMRSLGRGD
jgi:putative intracellular protease/amidase